jgi:hypothetical protein
MKVICNLTVFEVDGEKTLSANPSLTVESHWIQHGVDGLVVLRFEGVNIAVRVADLAVAAGRCRNVP